MHADHFPMEKRCFPMVIFTGRVKIHWEVAVDGL